MPDDSYIVYCRIDKNNKHYFSGEMQWTREFANVYSYKM